MSEDIRKMIDKVKNFKQFVNENIERTSYKGYNIGDVNILYDNLKFHKNI